MSSKDEIKTAFTTELKTTPEYQIVINIKWITYFYFALVLVFKEIV